MHELYHNSLLAFPELCSLSLAHFRFSADSSASPLSANLPRMNMPTTVATATIAITINLVVIGHLTVLSDLPLSSSRFLLA